MRLIDFFDRGLRLDPDAPCFMSPDGGSLSYRQCDEFTWRIANGLREAGLGKESNVGMLGPNHLLTMAAVLGIVRSASIWLPVNARNSLAENIHILKNGDCEFLFVHSAHAAELDELRASLPKLKQVVCIDTDLAGAPSLKAWAALQDSRRLAVEQASDDVVAIRGTGGTTGIPKGVLVTHRVYQTLIANFLANMPLTHPPVHLAVAPLTHAAGAVCFPTLAYGGCTIVLNSTDPADILAAIERYKVSLLFLPPTLIYRLLDHPHLGRYDYSSLRHFIYSAAPMSTEKLRRAIAAFGMVMVQGYGQAEAPFFCTCLTSYDHQRAIETGVFERLASCGRASPFAQVEIIDDDGNICGPHVRGEIVVRGDLVMKGYYKNPVATKEALAGGWLHTGDIGYRDDEGYFYIVDRKKDMIISGGFNIYPSEIEQVLWSHPAVQDCAVVGIPDNDWGEAVKAVVELRPGTSETVDALMQHCRERLSGFKLPKSMEIWETLPRSQVGKVLKREVRDRFWQGLQRSV
ncbi:AMP-binding protein [Alcaligenaceae bacterium]|nr:AMP-binding protein [Alcaligenaceae bacterium]